MDDPEQFKALQDQIQTALVTATRTAGQISSEDLSFQRSLNSEIGTSLDEQSARLLALSSSLLKSAASLAEIEAPSLQEAEDVDNNWRGVVDVVDSLLEKADTCLDEYTGVIKRKTPPTNEQVHAAGYLEKFLWLILCAIVPSKIEEVSVTRQLVQDSESCEASIGIPDQAEQ